MIANDTRKYYTRKSLSASLQKLWQYPLTVAEAPMGYGKTTAVRAFLRNSNAEVLWLTIFDSSVAGFWNDFSQLFRKIDPACADSLAELGVPSCNVFIEETLELFAKLEYPQQTVIVIDDYHRLSSDAIDRFFERLAQAEIPNLHIVIISRSIFSENTAELALKGYCLVLNKSCFELTAVEIGEYCKLFGVRLKADEVAFLHTYTEGWISAVYLFSLSYQQAGKINQYSANLQELIEKVVYQPYPAELKEFLVTICIFDSFSLAQAEYIWEKGNAEFLLARLTSENAFVTFDYAEQVYSLHNILSSFLRHILDRQDLDRRRALWQMAGAWNLTVGEYNRAMSFFYKAGDFEQLLTTIKTAKGTVFAIEPKEARMKYFRECPAKIKMRHPLAGIIYAFNLFISGETELFARQCANIEGYINNSPDLDEQSREKLTGELEVLKGITAYNNIAVMARHFKIAWNLLQGPSAFVDTKQPWTLGSPSVLYLYHRESGQLEAEVKAIMELPVYSRLARGHGTGGEYMMEAEWYYNIADFDNAEIVAHRALHIANSHRQTGLVLCAVFLQIRLALVRGDWDAVLNSLRQARETINQQALYSHIHILNMCEGFVFSCLNQIKRIPDWITRGDLPDTLSAPCHAFFNIIWDKALLITGQHRQLVGIAPQHHAVAAFFPNLLAEVYTYIFEAAALDKLWRRQDALAALDKALDIAAPDRLFMPFVENSEYIADLLVELQKDGHHPEFIARVREISPPIAARWQAIAAKLDSDHGNRLLTDRETAIAELVAEGLSNQAVGETLNITKDTVKKALKSIFLKLDVNNRTALTKVLINQQMEKKEYPLG
jgi:LuxR family transcriptional regulator, maltose regulon positive regulatory protein